MGVVTRDVKSIRKAGDTKLKGDVTLTGGANVTLTQSGQDISIAAAGGTGAPTDATYITQTANGSLSAEQALGALATGIMKVTTTTGVVSSLGDPLPVANGGTASATAAAAALALSLTPITGWIDANESWTYSSADGATGVITVPSDGTTKYSVGMRVKLTQTTVKYFIVTAVAATTLTVWGGTDYTLANAAISANSYSPVKAPLGFPMSPLKWSTEFNDTASRSQGTPTTNTWYNVGTSLLAIPIGAWRVNYQCVCFAYQTTVATINLQTTLSTANNSVTDADFNGYVAQGGASGTLAVYGTLNVEKYLLLASKTTYYLNMRSVVTAATIDFKGDLRPTIIRAICAYL